VPLNANQPMIEVMVTSTIMNLLRQCEAVDFV